MASQPTPAVGRVLGKPSEARLQAALSLLLQLVAQRRAEKAAAAGRQGK